MEMKVTGKIVRHDWGWGFGKNPALGMEEQPSCELY